ncbi:hypothetical protein ACQP60_18925 [Isoptericola variabilis]|uniref:hypothetical protein n=1 Tax=Isoptericola variabilis TaxID=139208 RepID=UPI003D1F5D26
MTRVKDPNGVVTDIARGLAEIVVGDGTRGFEYVDGPPEPDVPEEPKSNSPKADWLAWAEHLGIDVPDGTKLPELKELVAAHQAADDEGADDTGDDPDGDDQDA